MQGMVNGVTSTVGDNSIATNYASNYYSSKGAGEGGCSLAISIYEWLNLATAYQARFHWTVVIYNDKRRKNINIYE